MRHLPLLLTICLVAGCGGDGGPSHSEYAKTLDRSCARTERDLRQLPTVVTRENLDPQETARRGDGYGRAHLQRLRNTEPPEDLADEHDRLVDLARNGAPRNNLDDLIRRVLTTADAYRDVGARGCDRGLRRTADRLRDTD